jgi:hypothetical protein
LPEVSDRCLTIVMMLGLAAASLTGFAAYASRPLVDAELAAARVPGHGKADRLMPLSSFSPNSVFRSATSLPNATPGGDVESIIYLPTISPVGQALVATPLPPRRPKQAEASSNGLLNDAQINGIKDRLALTPQQSERWPAVESALREVARRHLRRSTRGMKHRIEVSSPEVQRLIEASVPLIRELREDQKREVRGLVRMIGLGTVASQI